MKKLCIIVLIAFTFFTKVNAQNYNNIVNYNLNGTPVNGVKIKTNLPFTAGTHMPTIIIQGYNYGTDQTIGLMLTYYVWTTTVGSSDPSTFYFHTPALSSFGQYTPPVSLSNENGKVVIFINDRAYYQRFTVSAFAQGLSADVSANYQGWTVADEALTGSATVAASYKTKLAGDVTMPGTGIWNTAGNVGIGTANPGSYKLAVKGNIHAQQVNVDLTGWADYVFKQGYQLPTLQEVKTYIDQNHHLSEIPSEQEIVKNGIDLGEMNKILVKKVEELTLYLIEKDQQQKDEKNTLKQQEEEIQLLKQQVQLLIKASNNK